MRIRSMAFVAYPGERITPEWFLGRVLHVALRGRRFIARPMVRGLA